MTEYVDRRGNLWSVRMAQPDPMPIHKGLSTHHWEVCIKSQCGASAVHGHQNLAEAIAQAVAKADWLRR